MGRGISTAGCDVTEALIVDRESEVVESAGTDGGVATEVSGMNERAVESTGDDVASLRTAIVGLTDRLTRIERKLDQLLEQPRPSAERGFRSSPPRDFRDRGTRFGGPRPGGEYDRKFPARRFAGREAYGDRRPRSDERRPSGEVPSVARPDPFAKFRKPDQHGQRGRWRK